MHTARGPVTHRGAVMEPCALLSASAAANGTMHGLLTVHCDERERTQLHVRSMTQTKFLEHRKQS